MTLTVNFFDLPVFREMIISPNQTIFYPLIIFGFQQLMTFSMVTFIALSVYLFTKAIAYEKTVAVTNEDEEQADYLEEIHEKVCQIFTMSKNGADLLESGQGFSVQALGGTAQTLGGLQSSSGGKTSRGELSKTGGSGGDKNFKNRKVVAWLTNRPIQEEQYERE